MALNVVMLGPPGAGKGTQAERLAAARGIPKVSTGDILRDAVARATPLGQVARAAMDAGQLVGDDIVIALVTERLAQPDALPGFVLDGFPRTVTQAEALDNLMRGRGPLTVLHVVVPLEELVRRVSSRMVCERCGRNRPPDLAPESRCPADGGRWVQRADDAADVVRERLRVFERQTRPLVEHYRQRGWLWEIDGNRPPDEVTRAIARTVDLAATHGRAGEAVPTRGRA